MISPKPIRWAAARRASRCARSRRCARRIAADHSDARTPLSCRAGKVCCFRCRNSLPSRRIITCLAPSRAVPAEEPLSKLELVAERSWHHRSCLLAKRKSPVRKEGARRRGGGGDAARSLKKCRFAAANSTSQGRCAPFCSRVTTQCLLLIAGAASGARYRIARLRLPTRPPLDPAPNGALTLSVRKVSPSSSVVPVLGTTLEYRENV